jgi:hypothetical protein
LGEMLQAIDLWWNEKEMSMKRQMLVFIGREISSKRAFTRKGSVDWFDFWRSRDCGEFMKFF